MFYSKIHEQTILEISQGDYISATADSFLIDRQARELSKHTLRFYREFLRTFIDYCNANSLGSIQEITADFDAIFSRLERNIIQAVSMEHTELSVHSSSGW